MQVKIASNEVIHFVGIGGIGMSGLAQIMHNIGFKIQGSDLSQSKNIDRLRKFGIKIFIGHKRNNIKKSPFHPFTLIDTVSLGVLATRQTVLARICKELNIPYDDNEAHSATYDANVTAQVFCKIFNQYDA